MALTATVSRSYTMVAGAVPDVDDWNTAFEPQVSVTGSVGTSDIEAGSITFPKLHVDFVLGGTNVITAVEGTDMLLVGDDSANANAVITVSNFWSSVQSVATTATAFDDYAADTVTWYRADSTAARKSTIAYFAESLINQAPLLVGSTAAADGVLITDASASAGGKAVLVDLDNLLPAVISAGTYTNPTSLTVRADGRLSAVNTSSSFMTTTGTASIPAAGAVATVAHSYAAVPSLVRVVLKCTATNQGYAENDEVPIEHFMKTGSNTEFPGLTVRVNATAVYVIRSSDVADLYVISATGGAFAGSTIDTSKWQIKVYAVR